jgi:Sec-independent protein translocase protein TatA
MPGIEDFRKRAKQMTEKARHHGQEETKARKAEEAPESPAERAKLRDAEEAPESELEPESERTEDLRRRRDDEI